MIAHVFKPRRRNAAGKSVPHRLYRGRFRLDGEFSMSDVALGTADKQIAEKRLSEIVKEKEREKAGLIAPKLERDAARKPLDDHLMDFIADLVRLGRSKVYVRHTRTRFRNMAKACNWVLPKDVTADCFVHWRSQQCALSPKTLNDYLNTANAFLNWMVRQGRIGCNPLCNVQKADTKGRQKQRRALTDDELERLLAIAGSRRLLYLTALYTGLRKCELAQLVWDDIHLESDRPFIHARASTTKNSKDAVIPLHPELAEELRGACPINGARSRLVFKVGTKPARALYRDLEAAGVAKVDELGRKVDFHALRHTFATNLARRGVSQRLAQELMRHSEPRLTAQIYTDASQLPTFEAIEKLPWFGVAENDNGNTPSQIPSQKSGLGCHTASQLVLSDARFEVHKSFDNEQDRHALSRLVPNGQMAEAEGFEPSTKMPGNRSDRLPGIKAR